MNSILNSPGLALLQKISDACPQREFDQTIQETIHLKENGNYNLQYNLIYQSRFEKLSRRFEGLNPQLISSVTAEATIAGLIKKRYKNLEKKVGSKKSSIAIETEEYVEPHILYSEHDLVEIEDSSGKIEIQINPQTVFHYDSNSHALANTGHSSQHIPFGVFVGIKGYLDLSTAKFVCQHIYFPQMKQQIETQFSKLEIAEEKQCTITVVSNPNPDTYHKLIQYYQSNREYCESQVLILCGDLLESQFEKTKKYQSVDQQLAKLCDYVNVVVLPDYGGTEWPHKPLPNFFLKNSSPYLVKTHNPTTLKINNFSVLVTNGENISSSLRASNLVSPLDIMETHLIYNHFAPLSPSVLRTMPLEDDCFVLESLPRLYLIAKQSQYATRIYNKNGERCRLVTIPPAEDCIVQINSKTLEVIPLRL